jgi:hypothetical protein
MERRGYARARGETAIEGKAMCKEQRAEGTAKEPNTEI